MKGHRRKNKTGVRYLRKIYGDHETDKDGNKVLDRFGNAIRKAFRVKIAKPKQQKKWNNKKEMKAFKRGQRRSSDINERDD